MNISQTTGVLVCMCAKEGSFKAATVPNDLGGVHCTHTFRDSGTVIAIRAPRVVPCRALIKRS